MKHISHVSANGITSYTDSQTVCVEGTGGTRKRKRRRKHGSDAINLPDNSVGVNNGPIANLKLGEKLAVSDYGGDKRCSNERSSEQGNGIPNENLGAEEVVVESGKRRRKRKRIKRNDIPYNHVVEDGQKQSKGSDSPDENESADGLACHSNLVGRVFDGCGGEKFVVVDFQRQKHRKGNDVADNHVGGDGLACSNLGEAITPFGAEHDGNCINGNKILDNHVAEDGQTKESGIPNDHVGVDGVACTRELEERICLAGTEGEKVVVESQKSKRRRKRKKGNGIPNNHVSGDGLDGNRILEYNVAEDGQKQTEGSGIPTDHVGIDGLACYTDFDSLAGTEGEKVEVESRKPRQKQKRKKGNGITENFVGGDGVDGNRILENHAADDGRKQTEGSGIPADLLVADRLACNTDFESLAGTEGEKVDVESRKPRRKRKRRKGNGIVENVVGGDGVYGTRILEYHAAEDGRKQTKGSGIPADHAGAVGLACNTDLEERICLAGAEGEKVIIESRKPKRNRKRRKGNGIPENLVGGDGLACSNTRVAISVVGTESNRNFIDGNRILDNHLAEDELKQTKSSCFPHDHKSEDGLTCHSNLVGKSSVGAGGEKSVVVEFQEQKGNKGNAVADNHVRGDGLACSNLKEAITPTGTGNNGNCIDGNKILGNHVAEVGQKQNGNGIPDDHVHMD